MFADDSAWLEPTNVAQLRQVTRVVASLNHRVLLKGNVLWANPPAGKFVLPDASGAALLEMDLCAS